LVTIAEILGKEHDISSSIMTSFTPSSTTKSVIPETDFLSFTEAYSWPLGALKDVSAFVVGIKPDRIQDCIIQICPNCLCYGSEQCRCQLERKTGYLLSLHLSSKKNPTYIITAYICGPEADLILQKTSIIDLYAFCNDGMKHKFRILKFQPEIVTFSTFGFQIKEIL
jgi:hypothetical protein